MPSVVNIATETLIEYHEWYDDLLRDFYGWRAIPPRQQKRINLGSGVIINDEGYVLTNFHVVHRATRIQVKLWDGREFDADPLVATAASDVALLKLKASPGEKFKAIKFAADDDLLLGETVLALGNPYGLGGSVTKGILSSKNRRPAAGDEPLNIEDWLQTDAAINPGNSGGPLVNLRGELIGLNVAVYRERTGERGMGLSFSIPVKQVSAALSRFFTPEVASARWFGAQLKAGPGPLLVASVQPASPAALAGLRQGDQVLQINGLTPASLIAFNRLLSTNLDSRMVVARGQQRQTLAVHLVPFAELVRQKLGFTLREPPPPAVRSLDLDAGDGMLIEDVERDSPAGRAKLQRGYILTGIDGQNARELRTVGQVVCAKQKGDPVQLTVEVPGQVGADYVSFRGTVEVHVR